MTDIFPKSKRSDIMRRIKSKDTLPELVVRRLLFSAGYRYRLHYRKLPGRPDIAFVKDKKAIFVHGCFWHGHKCRKGGFPKTNVSFWKNKILKNKIRDKENLKKLKLLGWKVCMIWECEILRYDRISEKLANFLQQETIAN